MIMYRQREMLIEQADLHLHIDPANFIGYYNDHCVVCDIQLSIDYNIRQEHSYLSIRYADNPVLDCKHSFYKLICATCVEPVSNDPKLQERILSVFRLSRGEGVVALLRGDQKHV